MAIDFDKTYNSNAYGDFKVIEDLGKVDGSHRVRIKFVATGYEKVVLAAAVPTGKVKDPFLPTIYGVGYIGEHNNIRENWGLYKMWHGMLSRCYNPNDKDYPAYGGSGVRVCDRWHCYDAYYHDVQLLPNYELKVANPDNYHLDKDYLQIGVPKSQRVYSPETCIWLSTYDNVAVRVAEEKNTEYYGVHKRDNGKYTVVYKDVYYGTYTNPIAAANAYNYYYTLYNGNTCLPGYLLNDVPHMEPIEFLRYRTNLKKMCSVVNKSN